MPAALIGGFGDVSGRPGLRDAEVWWRRKEWDTARGTKAEAIGWRSKMYRLQAPAPGGDPDVVDAVWDVVEPRLPGAVGRLQRGTDTAEDRSWLVVYAAMAGVRHPDFQEAINRWRLEAGQPAVSGDAVHMVRLEALANGLELIETWRWRILHSPPEAPRFILNDRAWSYVPQLRRDAQGRRALYLPLNSRLSAVAWLGPAGGFDHRVLRPNWVRWLNGVTWSAAPLFIVGHPQDRTALAAQPTADEVALQPITMNLSSFQGDGVVGKFLFDEM
ncbi:hypothetical protein [Phaeacidiphilus oryzae]|uniref:hypothetical protein n=1 Tax=Phaeacidiphilus oryzae TaxID=348818 RepID=UPI0005681306|nr:hypothetical protein [Phaeacidiphilus oryzae]